MQTITPKQFLSKVAIARQLLREKSEEMLKQYMLVIDEARASGDYETAMKGLQWLIEHAPADEAGERVVDVSVDKKQQVVDQGPVRAPIQIGIQVGGLGQHSLPNPKKPKELVGEVIDSE